MTELESTTWIAAPPGAVWRVLTTLEALGRYDPGVTRATLRPSGGTPGVGTIRRCELARGGWFDERVTEWRVDDALAFELTAGTAPLKRFVHRTALIAENGGTRVTRKMAYDLKFGALGAFFDGVVARRKFEEGLAAFFDGLKRFVEAGATSGA